VLYYRDPKDRITRRNSLASIRHRQSLEPVYADDVSTMPVGTVQITPEKQQLIGVKYGEVEVSGGSRTIRR